MTENDRYTEPFILVVKDTQFTITVREAVAIRDSLCVRLGCPSFCDQSSSAITPKGDSVVSTLSIENVDIGV